MFLYLSAEECIWHVAVNPHKDQDFHYQSADWKKELVWFERMVSVSGRVYIVTTYQTINVGKPEQLMLC